MSLYDKAKQTADFIKSKINNIPKTAIVLGSGLGPFAKEIEEEVEFDYKDEICPALRLCFCLRF